MFDNQGNNNHLIRNNHKKTYSVPQRVSFSETVAKCSCGSDYVAILTKEGKLFIYYESAFCEISLPKINDICTADDLIGVVT